MISQDHSLKSLKFTDYSEKSTIFFLVLLWSYTASDKFISHQEFSRQLYAQSFSPVALPALSYLIPLTEILTATLILIKQTRKAGMVLSTVLMIIFTIYVALAVFGLRDTMPCACGGVISSMGWKAHLVFNLFFLTLSVYGVIFTKKKGGCPARR